MNALSDAVEDYLALRRCLGFKLIAYGRLLGDFVAYLEAAGATTVTTDAALAWATQPQDATPRWWAQRLGVVRGFAIHLHAFDSTVEVPPGELLACPARRAEPHLYSDAEVAALMDEARALRPQLRGATYETLIGLLAVTGLRPGEALRLDRHDVDWDAGLLRIVETKFGRWPRRCRPAQHAEGAGPISPHARPVLAGADIGQLLCVHGRDAARPPHRGPDVPRITGSRHHLAAAAPGSPSGRPQAQLLGQDLDRLVPGGPGRRGPHAPAVHLPGAFQPVTHLLVPLGVTTIARPGGGPARASKAGPLMSALAPTLEAYFTERLIAQRRASPNTIAAYRDAWISLD